ncbi:hypothetical protein M0811_13656 [Anaeramoeba ignava]|uniref:Transmembrane protein n=1 Tax=Anaeramoeba ignava TaxID=1746090 RepID=A0A9Q0L5K1_ANAIG|nr:hypothetical protein M0811_13656 [Anaeramoeba ignava]
MRTSEVLPIWIVNSIIIIIIIAPSLGVASKDKDKDCSKPLWTWVLVFNIFWATREGVKDECGKLYSVTLGESIVIISLAGCGCLLLCFFGIFWQFFFKDLTFA